MKHFLFLFFMGISILALGWLGWFVTNEYFSDKATSDSSVNWTKTLATIEKSEVGRLGSLRQTSYFPTIGYNYEVHGVRYHSDVVSFPRPTYGWRNQCQDFLNKYPVGKSVDIFYKPADPQKACLLTGETPSLYQYFVQLGAILFVESILIGVAVKSWKNNDEL